MPLSYQLTPIEPRAVSVDCQGTSPIHRWGFVPTLAFLGDSHHGFKLNKLSEDFMYNQLRPLIMNYAIKVFIRRMM